MDLQLKQKKVVVTGGTRGIGRAIAEIFADEGANVALCARNEQHVLATISELREKGVSAFGDSVDIADEAAINSWISRAAEHLGGIDILVANPSAFGVGATAQDWLSGYNVDIMGTVNAVNGTLPYLEKAAALNGDASILLLSSAAIAETDFESAYGAYKAGLVHYAKGAARRLASKQIRVNSISPGTIYVEDGFWGNAKRHMPELYHNYFQRNPMGRMGCPTEVARVAAFLCSPAASFVTGTNVVVDGGWTSRVNY